MLEPVLPANRPGRRQVALLLWLVLILVALATAIAILFPMFAQRKYSGPGPRYISNVKQLGVSTLVYLSDNNEVFPPVQSMPTFRAVIYPYCMNKELFLSEDGKKAVGKFNFSISGVAVRSMKRAEGVPMYLLRVEEFEERPGGAQPYIIVFADSHVKSCRSDDTSTLEAFNWQFPRTAKTFFPPEYLADYDPIRDLVK